MYKIYVKIKKHLLFFLKKCIIYYKTVMLLERENVIMKKHSRSTV